MKTDTVYDFRSNTFHALNVGPLLALIVKGLHVFT